MSKGNVRPYLLEPFFVGCKICGDLGISHSSSYALLKVHCHIGQG